MDLTRHTSCGLCGQGKSPLLISLAFRQSSCPRSSTGALAPGYTMTDSLKAKFERDGYVIARNVLDPELIAEASLHVDWLVKKNPGVRPENLGHWLLPDDPFWLRLVSDARLLDIAQQFIGPDIALFASHYVCKPPRMGQRVAWHQDASYWPLEPMEVVSLWLAVSDSTTENGCMRVVPGTQTGKVLEMEEDKESVLGTRIVRGSVEEKKAVDLVLKAGDVSVHHPTIIHGSNANESGVWRKGLTIRYIPTSTKITNAEQQLPFLMRGGRGKSANEYLPKPKFDASRHMAFRGSADWA